MGLIKEIGIPFPAGYIPAEYSREAHLACQRRRASQFRLWVYFLSAVKQGEVLTIPVFF